MGRTAIVMSGGGAKGAFELGAVEYLINEHKVDPDVIVGVSTGTLNAAILAQGKGPDGLREQVAHLKTLWFDLREDDDIYYTRLGGFIGMLFKADSLYSNKPLWRRIQDNIDPRLLRDSGRLLRIGVVDLMSGEYSVIDGRDDRILEMIRASASIPVFFNPVDVGAARFVDGGVRNITPLNAAFDALSELAEAQPDGGPSATRSSDGPDTIYVILASPLTEDRVTRQRDMDSGLEIFKRSLSLLMNEVYRNDLRMAALINTSLDYHQRCQLEGGALPAAYPFAKYHFANLVLIKPDKVHMGTLEFDPRKIREAHQAGHEQAKAALAAAAAGSGTNVDLGTL